MSSPGTIPASGEQSGQPAPARSRYAMGTYGNILRSLLVVFGIVAVLVAIVPRVQSIQQPPVDAAAVVADAVRQSGLPFEAPGGLPDGWSPTNARYATSTDDLPTWQAGWTTPKNGYVAIRQTKDASPAWLQAATSGGHQTGTRQLAGRTWTVFYDSATKRTSLVDVPPGGGTATSMTTVVTAVADDEEITIFTTALKPAQPR
jgi:hypothetical protein